MWELRVQKYGRVSEPAIGVLEAVCAVESQVQFVEAEGEYSARMGVQVNGIQE